MDPVSEFSLAAGVSPRKVTRPEVFESIGRVMTELELTSLENRIDAAGYSIKDDLCLVNGDGDITALLLRDLEFVPVETLGMLRNLTLLFSLDFQVGIADARTIAALPNLEHLAVTLKAATADEVIREFAALRKLKSIVIGWDQGECAVDVAPLAELPHLESLLFDEGGPRDLTVLDSFPALKNLAFTPLGESERGLGRVQRLEKLIIVEPREVDFAALTQLRLLRALHVMDRELPVEALSHLTHLRALTTDYSPRTLDRLFGLTELRSLELHRCTIDDFSGLARFEHLEQLNLSGGQISDASSLTGHPTLRFLDLSENPIAIPPRRLAMPRLRHFHWTAKDARVATADFLSDCDELETLNLSGHAVADLAFVRALPALRSIDVAGNGVTDLGPMADLPALTVVDVSDNSVESLVPLAGSARLASLRLSGNPLGDLSALSGLTALEDLAIDRTGVSDLAFVKRLKQLMRLSAAKNQIRQTEPLLELPRLADVVLADNAIVSLPRDLVELGSLVSLRLDGNPLEGLEQELFSGSDGKITLKSLRDYYRGLSRGSVRHDQVKLVLVGNGRVGKTSVVGRLVDGTFDENQPSTHGIQLRTWKLADAAQDKLHGTPLTVNVWDFGGQDIYHATHRLFMRTRALFLLVWDRKTEGEQYSLDESGERYENFKLPYWIDYIKALSGSPVIVVQNKVDALADKVPGYGAALQHAYPPPNGILDFAHVSARKPQHNGMSALTDSIVQALDGLESIGRELPGQWVQVRDRLASIDRRFLPFAEFAALCAEYGLGGTEPESVANFFHQAGTIFYQKREFGDRIILDQKWAIEAVYALFDRRGAAYSDLKIAARDGLSLDLLKRKVWRHFSEDEHQLLLEFMKACELCFEFRDGIFYVPQLLPDVEPSRVRLRWPDTTEYSVAISYPFLHRAIIERFLVRTGSLGADDRPDIWKNGIVILDDAGRTEALVEAFPAENRILIQARGQSPLDLLQMIRGEFDDLQRDFPATVAVSANHGKDFVEIGELESHAASGSQTVPSTANVMTPLEPLRPFLARQNRKLVRSRQRLFGAGGGGAPAPAPAPEIFLSYAWGDQREVGESREAIVDRLYDTLSARRFTIIRDKKDNGYNRTISDFMRRIGRGRLIVVVVSDKYLRSPYCMYELLEIYEHGGFNGRLFPIVLADASIHSLADRLGYLDYWKQEKSKIEQLIARLGIDAFSSEGTYREYDLYYRRVFHNFDKLMSLLKDLNTLTPKLLEEDSFAALVSAIEERMAQSEAEPIAPAP